MYTNAQYVGNPTICIRVDINRLGCFVPLDPANTDYANIMALVAAGELTIAPAEDQP
jgi:hypothetical protein